MILLKKIVVCTFFLWTLAIINCTVLDESPNKAGFSDEVTVKWAANLLREKYLWPEKIPGNADQYNNVPELISVLDDKFTYYVNDVDELHSEMIVGVYKTGGFYARWYDGYMKVVGIIPNSPADIVGLKTDDKIIEVVGDGNLVSLELDSDVAEGFIVGASLSYNYYRFTVERTSSTYTYELEPQDIPLVSAFYNYDITNDVLYILLTGFKCTSIQPEGSYQEVLNIINQYPNCNNIILDLRGNGGGSLSSLVKIADLFVESGTLFSMEDRTLASDVYTASAGDIAESKKIAIWVDNTSASASELLTAAIKENRDAHVIGMNTYGKWVGQTLRDFYNNTGMWYVCIRTKSPTGNSYHNVGFPVDNVIDNKDDNALYNASISYFTGSKVLMSSPNINSMPRTSRDVRLFPKL